MDDFLFSLTLGMNQQRNGLSLVDYFLKNALPRLLPDSSIRLYEVFNNDQSISDNSSKAEQRLVFQCVDYGEERVDVRVDIPQLIQFKNEKSPSLFAGIQSFEEHLIIPVHSVLGPFRLLCIHDFATDPIERIRILRFIELFVHQIDLIDEMERDQLTGLLNRKSFNSYYYSRFTKTPDNVNSGLWLAILDIDHFKNVNDTYGHLFGDEVLLHFSQLIKRGFRFKDIPFRFGGEEFIILLDIKKGDHASIPLERFRKAVESYTFPGVGHITVSIGYTQCLRQVYPETLIDLADKALYFAKENGRNQVAFDRDVLNEQDNIVAGEIDMF